MKRTPLYALYASAISILACAPGCKKSAPEGKTGSGGTDNTTAVTSAAGKEAALLPIGMADPFARLGTDGMKALKAGFAANRLKKYDESREAFKQLRTLVPDYTQAWFIEAKSAALGGHFADVPELWGQLLARDYVAYAGRLDKPRELAALRAAPEWAAIQTLETRYKAAYARGLDGGFFFVARTRDAGSPRKDKTEAGVVRIDPNQEVFHYDPASKMYRRMTDTGGHAFAINVSPDRKLLSFLTVDKVGQEGEGPSDTTLIDPRGGLVDLATLETVGPFAMKGASANVSLYFTDKGEPVWDGVEAYQTDAARTALVKVARDTVSPSANASSTWAGAASVSHGGKKVDGAKISADLQAVEIAGVEKPLRAARILGETTLEWSPDRKRLLYAGVLDACKLMAAQKGSQPGKADKNELFMWDGEKKAATRVAQSVSAFDSVWLDADHFVYEGGVGKEGKLHLYEVSSRTDTVLKPRNGAGLFGYPSLSCEDGADEGGDEPEDAESAQ